MLPLLLPALLLGLGCTKETDADGDGFGAALDCDDGDAAVFPGADEACNEQDDDCDDEVDEEAYDGVLWYADADGDGYAGSTFSVRSCAFPEGFYPVAQDCDDGDAATNPGSPEICDGQDNDCDQDVDEEPLDPPTWYGDEDGDGFGDPAVPYIDCTAPGGFVDNADDCDDTDADANPDGSWFPDADGDGWGAVDAEVQGCPPEVGAATVGGDCDDLDPLTWPGAAELCDGRDQDCNELVDEDPVDGDPYWEDADGDGFGDEATVVLACTWEEGLVLAGGDCAPLSAESYPGAPEICGDLVDQDCNGTADNTCAEGRDLDELASARLQGPALSALGMGRSVGLLDLDQDGQLDLVGGAPTFDGDDASDTVDVGRVYLQMGPLSGTVDVGSASAWITGEDDLAAVGTRVLAVPSVDEDGSPGLLVAAPGWDNDAEYIPQVGALGIWTGPQSGALAFSDVETMVYGDVNDGYIGSGGLVVGDLDGDTFSDLLIGVPLRDGGAGSIFLLHGPFVGARSLHDFDLRMDGEGEGLGFGDSLAAEGDLDGDGLVDLVVGARAWRGQAFVWYGGGVHAASSEDADLVLEGAELGGRLGERLAWGDLDGDGFDDLLAAAPGETSTAGMTNAGRIHVFAGGSAGLEGSSGLRVEGASPATELGSVDGALLFQDLDLDGFADLGWGLPHEDTGGSNSGELAILRGPLSGVYLHDRADVQVLGDASSVYLGTDLAVAGEGGTPTHLAIGSLFGPTLGGEVAVVRLDDLW